MWILVTGANGFVGRAALSRLTREPDVHLRGAVRRKGLSLPAGIETAIVGDLAEETDWIAALRGVDVVVHAAARVHVMRDAAANPLAEFRRTNVGGTLGLARQAAAAGVGRFVFLSSIKVNGEGTAPGRPFRASDTPHPADPYGVSKLEAEEGLRSIGSETGMETVIIRPVLVYGPGVKANFRAMMNWLKRGIPLPFGAVHNRRSLVALDNLVDLIAVCVRSPAAANRVFLVCDGEDLSTTELLRRMAAALGVKPRLVPVPAALLKNAAKMLGHGDLAQRLFGSLQVDIGETRRILGWHPPVPVDAALAAAAQSKP